MKLYTKLNCAPCQKVKDFLLTRPDLNIEIVLYQGEQEILDEVKKYSQTFPTLVTSWGFVTVSDKIIEYLKSLSIDNKQKNDSIDSA